jgi:hypothetical protein
MSAYIRNECLGEITVFEKSDGPLTKRLAPSDTKLITNSSDRRIAQAFDPRALECREAAA